MIVTLSSMRPALYGGTPHALALLVVSTITMTLSAASPPVNQGGAGSVLESPDRTEMVQAIEAYLQPLVEGRHFSGVVLLAEGERFVMNRGYGSADASQNLSNTALTQFHIGSITKTFTAVATLLLCERGELSLDDPLSRYLPSFPRADDITIHRLLTHQSGVSRVVFSPEFADRSTRMNTSESLVEWIAQLPEGPPPGGRSVYSNANYVLLARVIEIVSGQPYGDFLDSEICGPLNLDATGHHGVATDVLDHAARGYTPVAFNEIASADALDYSVFTGAGSMYSSATDLLAWCRALQGDILLGEAWREKMFTPQAGTRGYGWLIGEQWGRRVFHISGWDGRAFAGAVRHFPDESLIVIVLCNLNNSGVTNEIADAVAGMALGEPTEVTRLDVPAPDAATLAGLAGTYQFDDTFFVPNSTMEIIESEGRLYQKMPPEDRLIGLLPTTGGAFVHRMHWVNMAFDTGDDGVATIMRYGEFNATRIEGE